eukprot:2092853-Rhodomonas_salina.1
MSAAGKQLGQRQVHLHVLCGAFEPARNVVIGGVPLASAEREFAERLTRGPSLLGNNENVPARSEAASP